MGPRTPTTIRDAFSGLAPARPAACPRCGQATVAFANGRSRLEVCAGCGIAESTTAEGVEIFRMRADRPER